MKQSLHNVTTQSSQDLAQANEKVNKLQLDLQAEKDRAAKEAKKSDLAKVE